MKANFYQVGGSVRDEILGIKSKDIDYAVEAPSYDAMRDAIVNLGGKVFKEDPQYFTIRAHVPNLGACDYVLCRKDGNYSDGRRPESVNAGTLEDDLARRDFTVNAIAKKALTDDEGSWGVDPYIDPHGGIGDLAKGIIRCVGNPNKRFDEDGLRILRAIRFAVTKGFSLHDSISNYLHTTKLDVILRGVSQERIREELLKAFSHDTIRTLELLSWYALDKVVFKDGLWLKPSLEKVG